MIPRVSKWKVSFVVPVCCLFLVSSVQAAESLSTIVYVKSQKLGDDGAFSHINYGIYRVRSSFKKAFVRDVKQWKDNRSDRWVSVKYVPRRVHDSTKKEYVDVKCLVVVKGSTVSKAGTRVTFGIGWGPTFTSAKEMAVRDLSGSNWDWSKKDGYSILETLQISEIHVDAPEITLSPEAYREIETFFAAMQKDAEALSIAQGLLSYVQIQAYLTPPSAEGIRNLYGAMDSSGVETTLGASKGLNVAFLTSKRDDARYHRLKWSTTSGGSDEAAFWKNVERKLNQLIKMNR